MRAFAVMCTYLDRPEAGSVAGGHVLVESIDGGASGHLTVLLVHVVGAGARVVADPDAEVLDLLRAPLANLRRISIGLSSTLDGAESRFVRRVCYTPR